MKQLLELLPKEHAIQLSNRQLNGRPEELRLCVGQPLFLRIMNKEEKIWPRLRQEDLDTVIKSACRQSVYAYTETIRQGYITVEGGHRIGICGVGVVENGSIQTIHSVSSLMVRVARQVLGCANQLYARIQGSTLLLGPPGSGKTTLLRDLIRQMSDKGQQRISLVDERGEVSAGICGVPQLDIGERTDVLMNVPKADAAMMMLRTMNPQWIAMDEISTKNDLTALDQISYCGVHILATAHGASMLDLETRPLYRAMMDQKVFQTVVILSQDRSFVVQEV